MENRSADYTYDFGDNWEHKIQLEKILPREKNINYPICIKGKRACPPEDCGGIWGMKRV
jgi:dihydropteroate synthase